MHVTTLKQLETNRFETANLLGKRFMQITDAEKYTGETNMLKAITGEDYLNYEEKNRQGGASFRFGGMVLIAANDMTTTGDYSGAIHRRRITVRFDNMVDATKRRDLEAEFYRISPPSSFGRRSCR
jgi:putative DNA primase/helicase